jgi:hypothetical protein
MEYLHSKIVLFIEASINLEPVFSFFSSHFTICHGEAEDPLATITVTGDPSLFKTVDFDKGESVYVRNSEADIFTIPGKKIVRDNMEYIQCLKTGTHLAFDPSHQNITVATNSSNPQAETLVFIELIRDLVVKNEENHGLVLLHATCSF